MKVLLTEAQLNSIQKEYVTNLLTEQLNESVNMDALKQKVRKAIMLGIAATTIIAAINKMNINQDAKNALVDEIENTQQVDSLAQQKIAAIKECMKYYLNLNGKDESASKLSAEALYNTAKEKSFDLALALAQGKIETLWGTSGNRVKETNSGWSIGMYDSGKNAVHYPNINASIAPYMDTMLEHYLFNKSVDQMLMPGKMVNELGQRYASDPNYEKTLRSTRNAILKRWPILGQS